MSAEENPTEGKDGSRRKGGETEQWSMGHAFERLKQGNPTQQDLTLTARLFLEPTSPGEIAHLKEQLQKKAPEYYARLQIPGVAKYYAEGIGNQDKL